MTTVNGDRVQSGPNLSVEARWERPVVSATGGEATLLVQVSGRPGSGEGTRRSPVDVAFVLDRSGSMTGDKLDLVKRAVEVAVGHLRDDDRAALVVYDHAVDLLHRLAPATPRAKTALRMALHGVDAGGSTNLGEGWLTGCRELSGASPVTDGGPPEAAGRRIKRALLLTDGLANAGITDADELTTHADELRRRGIGTTTLGVGLDFDETLLSAMAEAGGGNFQFVAAPDQLRAFFERELRELLTIAAAGLTVTLTLPPGVEVDLANAFPRERRGDDLEVALGDLPAGDEIDLVFTLRVPAGAVGTTYAVRLAAAWSDPAADAARRLEIEPAPLALATAETVAATEGDPLVAERAALQRATAARRAALLLDRAGRHVESRAGMRRAVAYLQAAPPTAAVRDDLAVSEHYAFYAASAPYAELDRKRGAFHNARRARGKPGTGDRPLAEPLGGGLA